jgi:putative membrane protein insertion efficiency factor/ribonuclease P protein component
MLPARYRLASSSEISRTIRLGHRARRGALVVHVRVGNGSGEPARAAFAVSKAIGDSVVRHRVTRRLRAVSLPLLDRLPAGTDVVVRAMPEAAMASSLDLGSDLERALERVATLTPPPSASTSGRYDEAMTSLQGGLSHQSAEFAKREGSTAPTGMRRMLWLLGWPIRSLLLGLIWIYRHTVSPMLPPTCRYHPSCSAYGFEALQVHGAAKGAVLTGWRVLRCNPFTPGGLDPVPPKGAWRPDINPDGTPRVTRPSPA